MAPGALKRAMRSLTKSISRSEEHTSELQSRQYLVCRLLLEKKKSYRGTLLHCTRLPSRQLGSRLLAAISSADPTTIRFNNCHAYISYASFFLNISIVVTHLA